MAGSVGVPTPRCTVGRTVTTGGYRIEALPNGYARVDSPSGLVSVVTAAGKNLSPYSLPCNVRVAAAEVATR